MREELVNSAGEVHLTIEYNAANHWVYSNWIGYQLYPDVVTGAEACLRHLHQHRCPYLLNDNRQVAGLWDDAVEWLIYYWAPRATGLGLTRFAHLVRPGSLSALSARAMQIGMEGPMQVRLFSQPEEAHRWLREGHQAAIGAEKNQ